MAIAMVTLAVAELKYGSLALVAMITQLPPVSAVTTLSVTEQMVALAGSTA